ncbi:MAG: methyltransferase domain-containing protein [Nitrospirae bacterium]|nr:methyltransferase domain-containing protein [Nitrospirota bacterium]
MGMEVLKKKEEIAAARMKLRERGLSFMSSGLKRFIDALGLYNSIVIGDFIKSWDVLKTANFIESNVKKEMAVLDIGAYASEILFVLRGLKYTNLTGIDLNPRIKSMPFSDTIHYEISNFMNTKFKDDSFDVITAISVIEHGFNSRDLLSEVSRLLKSGGYFVASFDYWPNKLDTNGIKMFDMDWKIFSEEEVKDIIDVGNRFKLIPYGNLDFRAIDQPISCENMNYTFGWLVLRKVL